MREKFSPNDCSSFKIAIRVGADDFQPKNFQVEQGHKIDQRAQYVQENKSNERKAEISVRMAMGGVRVRVRARGKKRARPSFFVWMLLFAFATTMWRRARAESALAAHGRASARALLRAVCVCARLRQQLMPIVG